MVAGWAGGRLCGRCVLSLLGLQLGFVRDLEFFFVLEPLHSFLLKFGVPVSQLLLVLGLHLGQLSQPLRLFLGELSGTLLLPCSRFSADPLELDPGLRARR